MSYDRLRDALAAQTRQALVHPVFFGSAITGAGVDPLLAGITELLPAAEGDADGPLSGSVFKVERGPAGEKIAYVRMFSGTVRTRDRLQLARVATEQGHRDQRVRARFGRPARRGHARGRSASSGASATSGSATRSAQPPATSSAAPLRPADAGDGRRRRAATADKGALHAALAQLAEQDPLINLRQDDVRQEIFVSLYGEVQKEVIQATLADDYGIDVTFRETTTICIERPIGTGAAVEIDRQGAQPVPRHRRPARRPGPGRHRRGLPAGGRARVAAARVPHRGRGDRREARCSKGSTAGRSPTARSP